MTPALPPPWDIASVPASSPITAIECTDVPIGSTEEFFSRTLPSSATCRATAACAADVTTAPAEPVCVVSNSPCRNIDTRIRRTWSSTVDCDTWPEETAEASALP